MNLDDLSDLAQMVGAATVVGGTVFALYQLSEMRRQREDAVAAELMRQFMDTDFANAIMVLRDIPDGITADEMGATDRDVQMAANRLGVTFEAIGLMVHRRIAPLDLVVDLIGGIIRVMWRKLGPWMKQVRIEQAQPSFGEWFQWLAEQCERHKDEGAPANIAHREWMP